MRDVGRCLVRIRIRKMHTTQYKNPSSSKIQNETMATFNELKKRFKNKTVRPQKETSIESYLFKKFRKAGYRAVKYIDPSNTGGPDRQILGPFAFLEFVETKTDENDLADGQRHYHKELRKMGYQVRVMRTKKQVDKFADYLRQRKRNLEIL